MLDKFEEKTLQPKQENIEQKENIKKGAHTVHFFVDGGMTPKREGEENLTCTALAKRRVEEKLTEWRQKNPDAQIIGSKFGEVYEHDGDRPTLGYFIELLVL